MCPTVNAICTNFFLIPFLIITVLKEFQLKVQWTYEIELDRKVLRTERYTRKDSKMNINVSIFPVKYPKIYRRKAKLKNSHWDIEIFPIRMRIEGLLSCARTKDYYQENISSWKNWPISLQFLVKPSTLESKDHLFSIFVILKDLRVINIGWFLNLHPSYV